MKDYDLKDNYYCYNRSIVLKNKFDIKDKKLLDSVEKDITGSILLLLQSKNFHKKEKYLIEYEYDEFIEKLSYFITELNIIHPFREGNGRVIREYFRILLERKNLFVDYSDKEKYLEAMIESPYNMNKLKQFLNNNLKKY
jgi:cell filamentation protein